MSDIDFWKREARLSDARADHAEERIAKMEIEILGYDEAMAGANKEIAVLTAKIVRLEREIGRYKEDAEDHISTLKELI